ncbi:MAG: hypothetical protein HY765_09800 [Rhodomicrobium sp.]|nr:hypothetical protein [Rhodomicrobium sp.]
MSKLDVFIGELDAVLVKLSGLRNGLKEMKEESEAVEKARDALRARRRPKKTGDSH